MNSCANRKLRIQHQLTIEASKRLRANVLDHYGGGEVELVGLQLDDLAHFK